MCRKQYKIFIICAMLIGCYSARAQPVEIKEGNVAPEIRVPNLKGDTIALSSLRGNLVLIDFWASWCAPCMEEQSELKQLYSKYGHLNGNVKGLRIFGVSLDSKKEAWKKAVRKYNLPWAQVSDLKFWTSPVAKDYQIEALPFNVIVDEQGVIIAMNLHGEALNDFVASYLKEK
ncbi:TlpA family protein disulfide reductase [Dyadobacter pollutisoli]|uniref:TlpA disulfide reductase family protein n=1 Tax=Dyadobacter pollutisoli TaxID=2910158 RepID=A0A9E8NHQ0_9BACT|nr:TlpA disulfide reductase family protein [Dyadobacter pollutisoli]WAC14861.1 TlpA disulfide reductase family protein [Dyadobacter pollutisoli]